MRCCQLALLPAVSSSPQRAASRVPHSLDQPSDPPQRHPRWAHLQPRHSPEPLSSRRLLTAPQSPWAARLRTVRSDLSSRLCSARVQAAQATLLRPDRHLDVCLLNACPAPGSGARRQTGPGGGSLLVPHLPLTLPAASTPHPAAGPLTISPLLPTSGLRQSCAGRQGPSPVLAERSPPLLGCSRPSSKSLSSPGSTRELGPNPQKQRRQLLLVLF